MLKIMAVVLLTSLALTGCVKVYTITVESNNPDWGTVTGGGSYTDGATVEIAAIPVSGFCFISWQDGNKDNPRTITVTDNATYIATFSKDGSGGVGGDEGEEPMHMSGAISENVTLVDRGLPIDYIVDGIIRVDGNALLTIAPGVTIMFTGVDGALSVGENAGIRMVGSIGKPIVFQGPTNIPTMALGVALQSTATAMTISSSMSSSCVAAATAI